VIREQRLSYEGDPEVSYSLSATKKVKVGIWKEKNLMLVHIREYTTGGDRECPT